jgi:hypothetical protein
MRTVFLFLCAFVTLNAGVHITNIAPSSQTQTFGKIKILDQKQLIYDRIGGLKFSEISDLAYYEKKKKLFMISDEGRLFTFKAAFSDKIDLLEPVDAVKLKKKKGKKFKKWRKDSEGLTLDGQGHLLISFEGRAKIAWFHKNSDKKGQMIRKYTIPAELRNNKHFRSRNKSLEALAWHPQYGILTASEWPLKKYDKKQQTIYALAGKRWYFKAEPEAKSAVSAMEVMDDGNILVLERSFISFLDPFVVTLKKVYLNGCKKKTNKKEMCRTEVLLKMNTHKGWSVDNFEGLTHVGENRYLMVSDDNDNFFQRTLLIYFEVKH